MVLKLSRRQALVLAATGTLATAAQAMPGVHLVVTGADLRAATPTVSAPPPLAAPTTAPTSAPISATNPASGLTQSVVGKAPTGVFADRDAAPSSLSPWGMP